jgi:hypothetical protein
MKYILIPIVLFLIWVCGIIAAILTPLSFIGPYKWAKNNFTGLDQHCNSFFFLGDPDETISSRCGKRIKEGCKYCAFLCRILDWGDKGHCEKAVDLGEGSNEIGRNT